MARFNQPLVALRVLIVEDEAYLARQLQRELRRLGSEEVIVATDLAEAQAALAEGWPDILLLDVNLPDGRGLTLLEDSALAASVTAIVMTSEGEFETVVKALRLGAMDFLPKPFELEAVRLAITRAQERRREQRRRGHAKAEAVRRSSHLFFGQRLQMVQAQVERLLAAEQRLSGRLPPVLITGETGTGKTTLAAWIHEQGTRADREMVALNCAALPEALAESELFGHEKGAFTDARETRIGLLEAADGSTLFLDEIASLSLSIQAKLLTALESGQVRRVGARHPVPVDARIIAASQRDLKHLVAEGSFREDLMHRLDLLSLRVPPLRECPDELPGLAEYLLDGLSKRYGIAAARLGPLGRERLRRYDWPGNVRELSHELERALILEDPASLELAQLGLIIGGGTETASTETGVDWLNPAWELPESGFELETVTQRMIQLALQASGQNVSAAARRLGVPRDFVRYRLRKQTEPGK